jgi:GT2 family glycosyltransferase
MVYIIIPVHNRKSFTRECLESLKNQTNKDFRTIVIDDGSTDGTSEMIEKNFPETILLKENGNLWWTKAINLGVKYALDCDADYILTLNDDTILDECYIEKMRYWSDIKPDALLGSFAFDFKTKKPVYGGEIINWKKAKSDFLLDNLTPDKFTGVHEVSHYWGRGLLIPAKVFLENGFYDDKNFPQLGADDDFTHRAKRKGFEIYCNYDAILYVRSEESGDYQIRKDKSFRNYYKHLFGKKGGGNLKVFTTLAIKNCPAKYLPTFLAAGIIKRTFGYLADWIQEILHKKRK